MPEISRHPATPSACAATIMPGAFMPVRHFYRAALDAHLHPLVADFLCMDNDAVVMAYTRRHPEANADALRTLLAHRPAYFAWAGADLLHVADSRGEKRMVLIENNSCPSGQKSLPATDAAHPLRGYAVLVENSFLPLVKSRPLPEGALAVICDKNPMETSGYAAALATLTGEPVYLASCGENPAAASARFDADGLLRVRDGNGRWVPVRAALRYVTQAPWRRIPLKTRTFIYNPVIACLAGGRNKLVAYDAYEKFNRDMAGSGLTITFPQTTPGLSLADIPDWVAERDGFAVIKDPYSNAGQGVWTIVNRDELHAFMGAHHRYDRFIGQSLIGHARWRAVPSPGYQHIATIPDANGEVYAFDLRLMIAATRQGYRPVSLYARRARIPLASSLPSGTTSWDMLGTNLSARDADGAWTTDEERLIPADVIGFARMGVDLDGLVEAFVQTVMSTVAIDRMASELLPPDGDFVAERFRAIDDDAALLRELIWYE